MENKLKVINGLFEGKEIRSVWDKDKNDYYFSVVDVINALTNSKEPRVYWGVLKGRLKSEGSQLFTICKQLKLPSKDGKYRETDVLDTRGILRLIESIPSPKAEPFKVWLANVGGDRIDEVFDPEIAIKRAVEYYRFKGFGDDWIKLRLTGIVNRLQLTDTWKESGVNDPMEYAILTNEIYKEWSGMNANDYKEYKGLRKESLRDNMCDIEVALTSIGEIATKDIAKKEKPKTFKENVSIAKRGGSVAKGARSLYEKETKTSAVSKSNKLNYKYVDDNPKLMTKNGGKL